MYNPKKISFEEAYSSGIEVNFELMDNGEKRYRLVSSDGTSYCRTVGSEVGSWQNSHYHKAVSEFYVVQSGWIVYAEIDLNGETELRFLREGESVIVNPFVHHNIFMSSNAVTHTIKYGGYGPNNDWFSSKELDIFTKKLSEKDLLELSKGKT
ncbi:cupin domain-containing protein [Bacillus sp. PS06]|uniref:cupin domain-containing protein n=1 Tax=Bacillus sp. PS06 TaxID=2764176 RepID=UPI00177AB41C|nr:cupin domain-containing protein [Bacillus sp. PS06]MBD8070677.1 cupin domain-containing protein [Bacillus sp. PS06]